MKSVYKLLIDIGPLAVFFIFYTRSGLQEAILPLMIATVISVIISYILEKKIPIMPTLGAAIVLIFGGLTIYFDNEIFIKMKPTIINMVFALILYGGVIVKKPLLKYLLGAALKLEEDGELCIQGPYVAEGYFKDDDSKVFVNGWFHTEDIFEEKDGHYFIIDRKKDIYKNSRGQTIAPQKIENLFQDFDSIKNVFLVGDGKEFNTVLIYPNFENENIASYKGKTSEIRELFSSMIFSNANSNL